MNAGRILIKKGKRFGGRNELTNHLNFEFINIRQLLVVGIENFIHFLFLPSVDSHILVRLRARTLKLVQHNF